MKYVALLRGINVGGNNTISMASLKTALEECDFKGVSTYINSGNIIFTTDIKSEAKVVKAIEDCIKDTFSLDIPVVVRSQKHIDEVVKKIPKEWLNDKDMRTDVMFLWEEADREDILEEIVFNKEVDHLMYVPGAVVWHFERANVGKSKMAKIIGTKVYKLMTARNVNTVRKLQQLMSES